MIRKLGLQSLGQRTKKNLKIQKKLFSLESFKKARCVCFYVSLPLEADTRGMIDKALKMGKRVLVPRINLENKELRLYEITDRRTDLEQGAFGIMEPRPDKALPVHLAQAQCLVVPGVVFDKKNHRIGHGGGYYDRLLEKCPPGVLKIGLAFSFQVVQNIPAEAHDVKLDIVLTD